MAALTYSDRSNCQRAAKKQGLDPKNLDFFKTDGGRWTWADRRGSSEDSLNESYACPPSEKWPDRPAPAPGCEVVVQLYPESAEPPGPRGMVVLALAEPMPLVVRSAWLDRLLKAAGCAIEMRDAETGRIIDRFEPTKRGPVPGKKTDRQPRNRMAELLDCPDGLTLADLGIELGWASAPGKSHLVRAARQAGRELEQIGSRWRLAARRVAA